MLARFDCVSATKKDADEYISVINQEYAKINVENIKSARPQEIQDYLQELRSQKK